MAGRAFVVPPTFACTTVPFIQVAVVFFLASGHAEDVGTIEAVRVFPATTEACPEGTFLSRALDPSFSSTSTNSSLCQACTLCPPGTFVLRVCGQTNDTVCVRCPAGTYSRGGPESAACSPCRRCPAGKFPERTCSRKHNAKCRGCPDGTFSLDGESCQRCSPCPAGYGLSSACTRSRDAVCEVCSPGSFAAGGDNRCSPCSTCGDPGQSLLASCTRSADAVCFPCPSGFHLDNVTSSCQACRACPPGSVVEEECGLRSDVTCVPCPAGSYSRLDGRACHTCSVCKAGWRQVRGCSAEKDTVCQRCPKDTYLAEGGRSCRSCSYCLEGTEPAVPCSGRRDTNCRNCTEGTYSPGHGFPCRACSLCPPGARVRRQCERKQDTVCSPCDKDTFAAVWSSDAYCTPCQECPRHLAVLSECRHNKDTVCGPCNPGYFADEATRRCLRCSYCYPAHPGIAVRESGCSEEPQEWQCRPLAYTFTLSIADVIKLNLTEPADRPPSRRVLVQTPTANLSSVDWNKQPQSSIESAKAREYSPHGHTSVQSAQAKDSESSFWTMFIVSGCVAFIAVASVGVLAVLIRRRCRFQQNSLHAGFDRLEASPTMSSASNVKLWLKGQQTKGCENSMMAEHALSLSRNSWPAAHAGGGFPDERKLCVSSSSVLHSGPRVQDLLDIISGCGDCRLYSKPPLPADSCSDLASSLADPESLPSSAVR